MVRARRIDLKHFIAPRVHQRVKEQLLDGGLVEKPLWYDVVCAHPPLQRPVALTHHDATRFASLLSREAVHSGGVAFAATTTSGQLVDPRNVAASASTSSRMRRAARSPPAYHPNGGPMSGEREQQVSAYCAAMGTHKWDVARRRGGKYWRHATAEAEKIYAFPQDIVYDEDRLRERFYREHPLERQRPQVMTAPAIINSSGSTRDKDAASDVAVRDGEMVVQYARRLMTEHGLAEDVAYRHACGKFYAHLGAETAQREQKRAVELEALRKRARAAGASRDVVGGNEDGTEDGVVAAALNGLSLDDGEAEDVDVKIKLPPTAAAEEWLAKEEAAIRQGVALKVEEERKRDEQDLSRRLSAAV